MIRLRSFTRKNKWPNYKFLHKGWGNGYVLLPKSHKYFKVHYDFIDVEVHGGLTFSELVDKEMQKRWGLPQKSIGMWCVGFDTFHFGDNIRKWPKERVKAETLKLKKQLNVIYKNETIKNRSARRVRNRQN